MAEILARMATTATIEQGGAKVSITKEVLETFAEQITNGQAKPFTVDHDPFCLPIGKMAEAWVEPFGEGYALIGRVYVEETYSTLTHSTTGVNFVCLTFDQHPKAFGTRSYGTPTDQHDSLQVDLANFADAHDYEAFALEVGKIDSGISCSQGIARHSAVPEPFVQFVISNLDVGAAMAVGLWVAARVGKFVSYTVDETLRKTADEVSDSLSQKLKKILAAFGRNRPHDDRPTTLQIVIPGNPELILLQRVTTNEEFLPLDLHVLAEEMERFGDILQEAVSAVFARTQSDDWKLQYITTKSGQVIGSIDCYNRTMNTLEQITKSRKSNEDASSE